MNAAGSSESAAGGAAQAGLSGAAESLTPGELLRRERERRSISIQQAAEDLHLDTSTVVAIEENRFAALGVPVYARGHLRKYAQLLGLSPEFIIQRYEALSDRPVVPTPVPASITTLTTSVGLERRASKGPLWIAIGLFALALGWWLFGVLTESPLSESLQPLPAAEPAAVEPAATEPAAAEPAAAEPAAVEPTASVAPAVTSPAVTPAREPEGALQSGVSSTTPAVAATDVRLRLEYSNASWTEVYDGTGRRLLFDLGEPGRVRTISGAPPLRVTLGEASAVRVQVNDRAVAVPRQFGRDSARFLIAANGAVQMLSDEVPVE